MEHVAALLLIIGCSDDLRTCAELPAPVPIYETLEECQSELRPALAASRGARPHVVATCVEVDPALEEADAELTWDVRPDGTLVASIGAPDLIIASNAPGQDRDLTGQQ